MNRTLNWVAMILVAAAAAMMVQDAYAQPGGGRGGRGFGGRGGFGFFGGATPKITLASLEQVQGALKLEDEAKETVADLNQELNEERRNIFQDNQGDFEAIREESQKLSDDIEKKLMAALSEPQQKRLQEIYIQVNGAMALSDKSVAEALKMTEEQQADYTEALADFRQNNRGGFGGGGQDLTPEERAERIAQRNAERDKALLAVLSDEQKTQFEGMKGEKIEIDMTALRGRGGFGGGRGGGGGRGNQ